MLMDTSYPCWCDNFLETIEAGVRRDFWGGGSGGKAWFCRDLEVEIERDATA